MEQITGFILNSKFSRFRKLFANSLIQKKEDRSNLLEKEAEKMFLAGLEPATFRVLGGRDNHYTTETYMAFEDLFTYLKISVQINC